MVADPIGIQITAYLGHLAVERGLSTNTTASYRRDLARYREFLVAKGIRNLAEVSPQQVAEFVTALRTGDGERPGLSATSAGRALSAVRGLHKYLALEGIVPVNAAREVTPPAAGTRLPKALDTAQVEALLAAAATDTPAGLRDAALLELLYSTGARISEVIGLDVDDIDVPSRSVVLTGKGSKQRVVPIGRPALAAVEAYLVRGRPALITRGTPALFLGARGSRLARQSAWAILRDSALAAGITVAVSPHTLRHSFATHMLDGGADVRVVQELLGHASVTTTQIYTLVTAEAMRQVWATAHPRAR